ncbi:DNA methyltransferase [Microbispora sp. H10836]|uniref:DNA methyltransferase n=1 Tax=Microbispora sp. H10836 TaxID=2729106 RepID=UPI001472D5C2|nr:DNA methyltransferase [Microbispora sp. H10836]
MGILDTDRTKPVAADVTNSVRVASHAVVDHDLRLALADFVRYRQESLSGDEKGEAHVFLDRLFRAFGHEGVREAGGVMEMRLKKALQKGTAFADLVWKPRCLIEMKRSGTDLSRHYRQAFDYWVQAVPDRPRYVVLCNFDEFWIYDFDNQMDEPVDRVALVNLPERHEALAFLLPEERKPVFTNDLVAVTREAAASVAEVFSMLHSRGISRTHAQRFTLQAVMAMFAEDIRLLPTHMFTQALEDSLEGGEAYDLIFGLFREMNATGNTPAGRYKGTPYFNGGLFADVTPFPLTREELTKLHSASSTNWAAVRPEIFGTLFEGSMAEGERHAYGAHFTSQADIVKIVGPTIVEPWRERIEGAGSIAELERLLGEMLKFRVLDPACGSGNFLYVAYRELRRLEHEIILRIADRRRSPELAAQRAISYVSADNFFGIDINSFAVEVAKVTMMLAKKLAADELDEAQQVLPLDNLDNVIVARDALFSPWPKADAIIGNPPYLGRRKMVDELGAGYTQRLAEKYPDVASVSDYVCYWFPLTHDYLPEGGRAGLVATKTVRETNSRKASLDYIVDNGGTIFNAVSSQAWSGDAVVHVSIINWIKEGDVTPKRLWLNNGQLSLEVDHIPSSLMPTIDVRDAVALDANISSQMCSQGQTPGVSGYLIDRTTREHLIANDPASQKVIFPFLGGKEMLHETTIKRWIIDIPLQDLLEVQTRYPGALRHLEGTVLPKRLENVERENDRNQKGLASNPKFKAEKAHTDFMARWWQLWRRRGEMISQLGKLDRYLVTSRVASANRNTVLTFVDSKIRPGDSLTFFPLDDDYSFGILSSSLHRIWLDARCSRLKADPRYTSTTVFDSFPWPQAPTSQHVERIATISAELIALRAQYLEQGVSLAKQYETLRTPGKNKLRTLHNELDAAVLEAYSFGTGEDVLTQVLALNQDLARSSSSVRGPGARDLSGARISDYRLTMT